MKCIQKAHRNSVKAPLSYPKTTYNSFNPFEIQAKQHPPPGLERKTRT
jgi:hypothetical protein